MRALEAILRALLRRSPARRRRVAVLVAGVVAIVSWQAWFATLPGQSFVSSHRVTASVGIQAEPRFFFYLYHLGLLPLATNAPIEHDTREEAKHLLNARPNDLIMEWGLTFASGDRGRVYLYYVDALLHRNRVNPSLRAANALAFSLALVGVFAAFWWIGRPGFGFLLVLLFGSNPFQLDAIHGAENVFSWSITAMLALLALHVPLVVDRPRTFRSIALTAIATGLLMATIRQVRSEPMTMLLSPILVYVTMRGATLKERLAPIFLCLLCFGAASRLYGAALEAKFHRTQQIVQSVGGIPFPGPFVQYHEVWHPIWCGLGDFDTKYGYAWDDRRAYAYVLSVLEARAGHKLDLRPTFWAQSKSYDAKGRYPIPFFELAPGYHDIVRQKVLSDIRRDPGWYLDILKKRLRRILTETTPVAVALGETRLAFGAQWFGPACVALALALAVARRWEDLKLLAFAAPLSLGALLIYSDKGMTSYTSFHLVGAALFASLALEGLRRVARLPAD